MPAQREQGKNQGLPRAPHRRRLAGFICSFRLQVPVALETVDTLIYSEMQSARDDDGKTLRRAAAAVLMCALVGAALVAARSGSAGGAPLEALAAVWKPFPVQGLNVAYSSLPPSFEAGSFDAGRLPKIGFSTVPAGEWDGKLPAVPVRENEKNHPLSLAPFERLPAVQQANISAAHAMAAAEVAASAYTGEEGGEEAGAGVEGEDQVDAAMRAQTTSASGRKAALKLLEKSAFALTAKAEAAMKAVEQAEVRIEQQEQPGRRQMQRTHTQLVKRGPDNFPKPRSISRGSLWGGDSREAGALLAARREVDRALQHIAEKHNRLRQPQMTGTNAQTARTCLRDVRWQLGRLTTLPGGADTGWRPVGRG